MIIIITIIIMTIITVIAIIAIPTMSSRVRERLRLSSRQTTVTLDWVAVKDLRPT